jgi:hypothetical protein
MISLFTIPRSFTGSTGVRQRNAIGTWLRAIPDVEVMLLGDDPGVSDVALELGVRHLPDVRRNDFGTPFLDSAFALAQQHATHDLLGYINTDILLMDDFVAALKRTASDRALIFGRRTDLDVESLLDLGDGWQQRLAALARREGTLMHPYGSDYFIFRKDTGLCELPPFVVGRPGWDNWFIARALQLGMPVIDITASCVAVHQNHGYGHVPAARGKAWEGPEGDRNYDLAGGMYASILDATHRLTARGIVKNTKARRLFLRVWYAIVKRCARFVPTSTRVT